MLEGDFTRHNFFSLIRSLSYKRRQGVLTLEGGSRDMAVFFRNGEIVGVEEEDRPASVVVVAKLRVAGKLDDDTARKFVKNPIPLEDLVEELVDTGIVSEDDFFDAKRAYEMDRLHSLRSFEGGKYIFKPKVVKIDKRFSLDLAPGQLSLDIIELDEDEESFAQTFGGVNDTKVVLTVEGKPEEKYPRQATLVERIDGTQPLKAIYNAALMCEHELRCLLGSLHEKELISVKNPNAGKEEDFNKEELAQHLIEQAAQELEEIELASDGDVEEEDLDLREVNHNAEVSSTEEDEERVKKKDQAWRSWAETAQKRKTESLSAGRERSQMSLHNRLIAMNYRLIEPGAREACGIMVIVAFFASVSVLAPSLIDVWFEALSNFPAK